MPSPNPNAHLNSQALRVLIVDDKEYVREELGRLLELAGDMLVVGVAANGEEALLQAEKLRPDVVLMDLEMPVLDGWEATRLLKARGLVDRIVVLTIHTDHESKERAREAGADAVVIKGSDLKTLMNAIMAPLAFDERRDEEI